MARIKLPLKKTFIRLFADDVVELQRRAVAQRLPWQVLCRGLVHDALRARKVIK